MDGSPSSDSSGHDSPFLANHFSEASNKKAETRASANLETKPTVCTVVVPPIRIQNRLNVDGQMTNSGTLGGEGGVIFWVSLLILIASNQWIKNCLGSWLFSFSPLLPNPLKDCIFGKWRCPMWELYIKVFEQGACIICKFMVENFRNCRKVWTWHAMFMNCFIIDSSSGEVLLEQKQQEKEVYSLDLLYKHNYEWNFHCKSLLLYAKSDFMTILTAIIKQITALIKWITWLLKKSKFTNGHFLLDNSKKKKVTNHDHAVTRMCSWC